MTDNFYKSPVRRSDVVKVKFVSNYTYRNTNEKNIRIKIIIGTLIADQIGWKDGDKISICGGDKTVMLRKIEFDQNNPNGRIFRGHKISKVLNGHSFLVSCGFHYNTDKVGLPIKTYPHEIVDKDGLKFLMVKLEDKE